MKGYFIRLIRDKEKPDKVHPRLECIDEVEGYVVAVLDDNNKPQILFIFRQNKRYDVAAEFKFRGWKQIEKTKVEVSEDLVRTAKYMLKDIDALQVIWEIQKKNE